MQKLKLQFIVIYLEIETNLYIGNFLYNQHIEVMPIVICWPIAKGCVTAIPSLLTGTQGSLVESFGWNMEVMSKKCWKKY